MNSRVMILAVLAIIIAVVNGQVTTTAGPTGATSPIPGGGMFTPPPAKVLTNLATFVNSITDASGKALAVELKVKAYLVVEVQYESQARTMFDAYGTSGVATALEAFLVGNRTIESLTLSDIDAAPLDFFFFIKPNVRRGLFKRMKRPIVSYFCTSFKNSTLTSSFSYVDFNPLASETCSLVLTAAQKKSEIAALRAQTADNWSSSQWSTALSAPSLITSDDLGKMSGAAFIANIDSLKGSVGSFSNSPDKLKALGAKLTSSYGSTSAWTATTLESAGALVQALDISDIRNLPAAAVASSLSSMSFPDSDRQKKAAIKALAVSSLGDASTWSQSNVESAVDFIKGDPSLLKKIPPATLAASVATLSLKTYSTSEATFMFKQLAKSTTFNTPSSFSASTVESLGNLLAGAEPSFMKSIPAAAAYGALSTLKSIKFSPSAGREMAQAVLSGGLGSASSFDSSKISDLGGLMQYLPAADITAIPDAAIAASLSTLKDIDFSVSVRMDLIAKASASSGGVAGIFKDLGPMASAVGIKDLGSMTAAQLGITDDTHTMDMKPSVPQAAEIFAKIVGQYGEMTQANEAAFTSTRLTNWNQVLALGPSATQIQAMGSGTMFQSWLDAVRTNGVTLTDGKAAAALTNVESFLGINTGGTPTTDSSTIVSASPFLKFIATTKFSGLSAEMKSALISELISADIDDLTTAQIKSLFMYSLQNVDVSGTLTDQTNAATLTSNDVSGMGKLLCGINTTYIAKLDQSAFESSAETLAGCVWDKTRGQALYNRAKAVISNLLTSEEMLTALGAILKFAPSADLTSITDASIAAVSTNIYASLSAEATVAANRQGNSVYDISVTDQTEINTFTSTLYNRVLTGVANTNAAKRRRRRSTVSLTCSDIQAMGSEGCTSLTESQINGLSNTDFQNCVDTLGAGIGWSTVQLNALVTKAKAAYGGVNTWSSATIGSIGSMAAGLTSTEIGQLLLADCTAVAIGSYNVFTSTQLAAAFTSLTSNMLSSSTSSVTSTQLTCMGNFACGATSSQIATFTTYSGAASAVGKLTTCDNGQFESYATLAKQAAAFGSTSSWTGAVVGNVGTVVSGLSTAEISALTQAQIQDMTNLAISVIPSNKITAFSTTQISYFSTSQALSVTAAQQNAMSATQLAALFAAGAVDLRTSNSSANVHASCAFLVGSILLAVFRLF